MAFTFVGDGEVSSGAVLGPGDYQTIGSDTFNVATAGRAYNTTITGGGGSQRLIYGSSYNVTVGAGGQQNVQGSGTSYGTILNGGNQYINPSYDEYSDGRSIEHLTFGTANGTIVNSGSRQYVASYANGTVVNDGGQQIVSLPANSIGLANVVTDTTVNPGGLLFIQAGSVSGIRLVPGGIISFPQTDYAVPATASFDRASNMLTVTDGSGVTKLQMIGDYSNLRFNIDENGGQLSPQAIQITAAPLCFCAGTRIATPAGEIAVEALNVGDEVLTTSGRVRSIRWIGSRDMIVSADTRPVIVERSALAPNCPARALRVTRGHSFLFRDVLIPIGALVNGDSIRLDMAARRISVFHIELDVHDVLLAEGAPAESFRDVGNRAAFAAAAGRGTAARGAASCAPVISRGPIVDRTRCRLAARAAEYRMSPVRAPGEQRA